MGRAEINESIIQPHLGFFADKFKLDSVLEMEIHDLKEQGDHDVAAHLKLWSGDLVQTIKTAAKTGKLNDWMVSMAAGTSYSLWKEICLAYALQLIKDDDIVKGASYLLMTHQVLKAIEILKKNHFYRAAIAIAKSRLPEDAPLLQEIYSSWASQATSDGSYELAAKCWISAGEFFQAASLLAKRPDPSSLRVASFLAAKAGEYENSRVLAAQCATECIKNKDWKCMEKLVQEAKQPSIDCMWADTELQRKKTSENKEVVASDVAAIKADSSEKSKTGIEKNFISELSISALPFIPTNPHNCDLTVTPKIQKDPTSPEDLSSDTSQSTDVSKTCSNLADDLEENVS